MAAIRAWIAAIWPLISVSTELWTDVMGAVTAGSGRPG
jgi:hypothetical protein